MTDIFNAIILLSNFVIVPGIAYGCQLALGALGVTLVYGILRFANFAHGDQMAFGTMVAILITWWFQALNLHVFPLPTALLALPLAIIIAITFSLVIDKFVYKHYRKKRSSPAIFVIASIGVMFVMNGIVRFIIGPNDQLFSDGERFIIKARLFKELTGLSEGITFKVSQCLTILIAFFLVAILFLFLQKTRTGKAMRAYADNEDLALLSGIDSEKIVKITWIITATLATIGGTLYGLDKSFKPFTYFQLLLPFFAAAILGGIGKPLGAIIGGFIVSFSEISITYAYKKFIKYLVPETWAPEGLLQILSTDYKFAVSFIILVLVLLIRPTGILKGQKI